MFAFKQRTRRLPTRTWLVAYDAARCAWEHAEECFGPLKRRVVK